MGQNAENKAINILIVEDSEDDLFFIKKALSDKLYKTQSITSGIEAYNYLLNPEIEPDIVLLDYKLPGMSGIEVLESINKQENLYSFIFLTIDNKIDTVVKAMKAGALDFIVKTPDLKNELPAKIDKVLEIHRNKIEKKQNERELLIAKERAEASEQKFRLIFSSITEGVALNEMIFNDQGEMVDYKILEVNEAFYQFTQFNSNKVIGNFATQLYSMSSEMITTFWKSHKEKDKVAYAEMQDPSGDRWFYVSTTPFKNDKFVTVFFDITERKNAEQALKDSEETLIRKNDLIKKQNKELRKLNDDKDRLFSIIGHDLKGPLNSLTSFTHLLINHTAALSEEEIRTVAQDLDKALRNLYELIENLLHWARAQTGTMEFDPEHFKLAKVINENIVLFSKSAIDKKIKLEMILDEEVEVFADINSVRTVIRNLMSNAIKFTKEGGTVTLKVKEAEGEIEISVVDTGVGMHKEALYNIFNMSINKSEYGTNNEKGTGLGLQICKEFVEKHRGRIWAESEVGKGSVFYFTIPKK